MTASTHYFDVIVVGGGHAGCEAALAAARLGARTLLLSMNLDHIAQMSCNPAIGGIAKGQVVREIDALGGEMGRNADMTAVQFRMLNRSKGPAVWSPRAQCDKVLYQRRMKHVVERRKGVITHQAEAVAVSVSGERATGVRTQFGDHFRAAAVVLCAGTFLRAILHYGPTRMAAGRAGDPSADRLGANLRDTLGLQMGRLKTGTPPRILGDSIDVHRMQRQDSDRGPLFAHWPETGDGFRSLVPADLPAKPCYLLKTTARTRDIVLANIDRAPMYNGTLEAVGTRYCPSFEDKVMRFPDHDTHQLYLEPEGAYTEEYYLNGISTSLPVDVQWQLIRSLPGLEGAELTRYAYAVEYDFVFPHQLQQSLALRRFPNLFLAGQVNGTTGYEEAAAQGLLAGINAARLAAGRDHPLVLGRDAAYIGVLIDDLVTKDITEPYRLFTSRAEHRLSLRQDNAWRRLTQTGYDVGLVPEARRRRATATEAEIRRARAILDREREAGRTLWERLRRQDLRLDEVRELAGLSREATQQLELDAHYEGYIKQEMARAASMQRLDAWRIPASFSFEIDGLRQEARAKLTRLRPETLAQATRIDGVTPAEIALLQVHLKRAANAGAGVSTG